MQNLMKVGKLRHIMPGEKVTITQGLGKYRLVAEGVVALPVFNSIHVRIDTVIEQGPESDVKIGDVVLVGVDELFIDITESRKFANDHFLELCRKAGLIDSEIAWMLRSLSGEIFDLDYLISEFLNNVPEEKRASLEWLITD